MTEAGASLANTSVGENGGAAVGHSTASPSDAHASIKISAFVFYK